jgi:hypothetical protein
VFQITGLPLVLSDIVYINYNVNTPISYNQLIKLLNININLLNNNNFKHIILKIVRNPDSSNKLFDTYPLLVCEPFQIRTGIYSIDNRVLYLLS